MPPKRKGVATVKKKTPKVETSPEVEAQIKEEIEFAKIHFGHLQKNAKNQQQFDKYQRSIDTLGPFAVKIIVIF